MHVIGRSPIYTAAFYGHIEVVKLLVELKVRWGKKEKKEKTWYTHVLLCGH